MTVSAAESISRRFKLARENAGLSQTQAAKLASIRRPAVAEIESGRRRLSAEEAARFAKIYRVSVSWLTCAAPRHRTRQATESSWLRGNSRG